LLQNGDQHQVLGNMQTREQLYSYLDYHQKEQQLDESMEQE
jgi:methylisocitrate lyase